MEQPEQIARRIADAAPRAERRPAVVEAQVLLDHLEGTAAEA